MRSVKYSRLPTTEDSADQHAIDMTSADTFNFSSAFDYEKGDQQKKYASAFTYSRNKSTDIAIEDVESESSLVGVIFSPIITLVSYLIMVLTFPISAWFTFKTVKEYERMVVYRVGKLKRVRGPGITLVLPCIDRFTKVDVRTKAFSVPPQKAMTADGATIEIGAEVYYQVSDPIKSVACIQDYSHSMRSICQLSLQKMMSRYTLTQTQSDQVGIGHTLKGEVNITTADWGVEISKIQISPVKVVQEPNALLEGCNAANAPLDWLGPMLFPPGTTQMPIQPLQERGLLPQGPSNEVLGQVFTQMIGGIAASRGPRQAATPSVVPGLSAGPGPVGPSSSGTGPAGPSTSVATVPTNSRVSPRELLVATQPFLTPELVNQVKAVFLFKVTGQGGGDFFLDLKNGNGNVGEGLPPGGAPDVTLTLSVNDMESIFLGEVSAFQAYVAGRLKIDGDLHSAMALQSVVEAIQTGP